MSPPREAMGIRLKKLRRAKGMSQAALAKGADISRGYLIRLEAGEQDPTLGTLMRLAKALKVPLATLLGIRRLRRMN
jgi:transcriptional regulator with XRE-family HTH domain